MAITRDRIEELQDDAAEAQPAVGSFHTVAHSFAAAGPTAPSPITVRARTRPYFWAWILTFGTIIATEPEPTPGASEPVWAIPIAIAFLVVLGTALVSLFRGGPLGLRASAIAGGLGVVLAIECLAVHHGIGAWTVGQTIGFAGLGLASLRGIRRGAGI